MATIRKNSANSPCAAQHTKAVVFFNMEKLFQECFSCYCVVTVYKKKEKTEYDHFETTQKTSTTTKQIIFTSNTQHAQKLKSVEVLLFTSTKEELGSNF